MALCGGGGGRNARTAAQVESPSFLRLPWSKGRPLETVSNITYTASPGSDGAIHT